MHLALILQYVRRERRRLVSRDEDLLSIVVIENRDLEARAVDQRLERICEHRRGVPPGPPLGVNAGHRNFGCPPSSRCLRESSNEHHGYSLAASRRIARAVFSLISLCR